MSGDKTKIAFANASGCTVRVFWLREPQDEVFQYDLVDGGEIEQPTIVGHWWHIRKKDNNELLVRCCGRSDTFRQEIPFRASVIPSNIAYRTVELDKARWRVVSFSSEETQGGKAKGVFDGSGIASAVIDGKRSTFWHSEWIRRIAQYPHFLVIDLSETQKVDGFSVVQRAGLCRAIKNMKLYKSLEGVDFSLISSYVLENIEGAQVFDFGKTESFRFLKLVAESSWDGQQFAALSGISLHRNTQGNHGVVRPFARVLTSLAQEILSPNFSTA
jgi:hypothetical protein